MDATDATSHTKEEDALRIAIKLIVRWEGFRDTAYLCPKGVPTIGYGRTIQLTGNEKVKLGDTTTQAAEEAYLIRQLIKKIEWLRVRALPAVYSDLKSHQIGALLSLLWNIGEGNFLASTVRRQLLLGNAVDTAWEFWKKVDGQVSRGLVARRAAELKVFNAQPGNTVVDP